MSSTLTTLLAIASAYLLGSISFALLASRLFGLADPRTYGSKNPGATNVLRSGHRGAAVVTLLGDVFKGWLAVFLAKHYTQSGGLSIEIVGLVAVAVFLGHLFPIFLKFKGGKGVATAAGVLLAIDPWLGLATLATWLTVAFTLRYSSLSALTAAVAAPLYAWLLAMPAALVLTVGAIAVALVGKHWSNLQRLLAGNEPKIGARKKSAAPPPDQPQP